MNPGPDTKKSLDEGLGRESDLRTQRIAPTAPPPPVPMLFWKGALIGLLITVAFAAGVYWLWKIL